MSENDQAPVADGAVGSVVTHAAPVAADALPSAVPADGADSSVTDTSAGLPPMFEVAAQSRRARLPAGIFAVAVLVVASVLGHWLVGIGACIGVVLGGMNAQLLQASMVRFTVGAAGPTGSSKPLRKQFVVGGFARLGVITVAVIVLVALVHELGWGLLIGLAGFQLTLLSFSGVAMYRQLRGQVWGA